MKPTNLLTFIILFLIMITLSFQVYAQTAAKTNLEVKAVRLTEFYPFLLNPDYADKLTPTTFLRNSSPKLDKSIYYKRKEGVLYFIDKNGQEVQSFDLKRLGLDRPGHNKWNPDGTMMLSSIFNKNKGGAAPLYLLKMDGSIEETVPAEGRSEQILQPSWSFDGEMFVYLKSLVSGQEIWVKNIRSGQDILIEKVSIGEGSCGNPVWFNRHQRVLYKKARPKRPKRLYKELWIYDLETGGKKKIYEGLIETTFPIISPDDQLIGSDTGKKFSLIDISGITIKKLEPGSNINPLWSPDGLNIAYLKGKVDPISEILIERHIHVININTGIDKNLTPQPGLVIKKFRWFNSNTIVY